MLTSCSCTFNDCVLKVPLGSFQWFNKDNEFLWAAKDKNYCIWAISIHSRNTKSHFLLWIYQSQLGNIVTE